ncbi:MAG: hypothetical protein J6X66_06340, partial [Lachnospiraceae bacterium]|nr:hypothetical protein [Lachnospiraceae bacterium]
MKIRKLIQRVVSGTMAGIMLASTLAVMPSKEVLAVSPAKYDAASAVNYSTILKRAKDFGIVADEFVHRGHTETTYAVKSYENAGGANNDVDYINGTAQFIIGALKGDKKIIFGVNHHTNKDGSENKINTFNIETTPEVYSGYKDPYTVANPESDCGKFSFQTSFFRDKSKKIPSVELTQKSKKTIDGNIDAIIENAQEWSVKISDKAKSPEYALKYTDFLTKGGDNYYTIDIAKDEFKDKVVYINVDSDLARVISTTSGLTIKKYSSTVVAFNVENGISNKENGTFATARYIVKAVDDKTGNVTEVTSHTDSSGEMHGDANNTAIDKEICQKIIWNIRSTGNVALDVMAGAIITPYVKNVNITGSAAGWLVSSGKVDLECEWHYIYQGSSENVRNNDVDEINFAIRKAFTAKYNGKATQEDTEASLKAGDFTFGWYETDSTYNTDGKTPVNVKNYETSMVDFPVLKFSIDDVNKDFYYVIKEIASKNEYAEKVSDGYINIKVHVYDENNDKNLDYKVDY